MLHLKNMIKDQTAFFFSTETSLICQIFFFFFISIIIRGGGGRAREVLAFLSNFNFCCLFVRFCRCGFFHVCFVHSFTDL